MRVAFVLHRFPALSETFILNQIVGLIQLGHDVDIHASLSEKETEVHPDVEELQLIARVRRPLEFRTLPIREQFCSVSGFLMESKPRTLLLRSLNPFLRFGRVSAAGLFARAVPATRYGAYDVLHCHYGPNGNLGLSLRNIGAFSGPVVTSFYGYDVSSYVATHGPGVYERLFRSGDLFLAVSDRMRRRLVELGCPSAKAVVHRLGIDLSRFECATPSSRTQGFRILSLARLTEKKGLEFGIRAAAKLHQDGVPFDYRIVGDGTLRGKLEALIRDLHLEEHVRLLGWRSQPDIVRILQETDVFLAPSVTASDGDEEGLPVAISEAMAFGIPVVGSAHAGIPELIEDGVSGFLVGERDVASIASKLSVLASSEALRRSVGRAARVTVSRDYDINRLSVRLAQLYASLTN